jgi:hypothetical protein
MSSRPAAHFLLYARPQYAHFQRRSASFRIREERTGEEISSTVGTGSNEQSHGFLVPFVPIKGVHIPKEGKSRAMNIEMKGQPGNMSVPALAARCLHEINSYRRGETQDIPSYLELCHRARVQHDDVALEALRHCFSEFLRDCLHRHPQKEVVCRFESEEYYAALAFERFWQAIIHRQVLEFGTLAAALAYLQASLNGVILDTLRAYSQSSNVAFLETDGTGESVVEHAEHGGALWEIIQRVLPNEREQRVAYLLFHCGLQPGEIVRGNPQEFGDVQEVARLRRTIIARLVRSESNLLEQ